MGEWNFLITNESDKYCVVKNVYFSSQGVTCNYEGQRSFQITHTPVNRKIDDESVLVHSIIVIPSNEKEYKGILNIEIETLLGVTYRLETPEIEFKNKRIVNKERFYKEYLSYKK